MRKGMTNGGNGFLQRTLFRVFRVFRGRKGRSRLTSIRVDERFNSGPVGFVCFVYFVVITAPVSSWR